MKSKRPNLLSQSNYAAQINFTREGRNVAEEFSQAIRSAPLGLTVLELAWTAGPLTFIALQIGYVIGFGKLAPWNLIIYFGVYTLVAGIVGSGVKFIFNRINEKKSKAAKNEYTFVIDKLFDAYLIGQDHLLQDVEPAQQKYVVANILFSNLFITPATFGLLCFELMEDPKLARQARKILICRRAGMQRYADTMLHEFLDAYKAQCHQLKRHSKDVYRSFMQHLRGSVPNLKHGVKRPPGFLERLIAASRSEDQTIISMVDVQALLNLTLEILAGRHFTYFTFDIVGNRTQSDTFNRLERIRHELSVTLSGYYGRINALMNNLFDELSQVDKTNTNLELKDRVDRIVKAIEERAYELHQLTQKQSIKPLERKMLRSLVEEMVLMIHLYKKLLAQSLRLERKRQQFEKASLKWQKIQSEGKKMLAHMQTKKNNGGIVIKTKTIEPSEEQLMTLTKKIAEALDENKFFTRHLHRRSQAYLTKHAINLAMDLITLLDEALNISNPIIQNTLQATHAVPINCIELGYSASYKLGLVVALCKEIQKDITRPAEQMINVMLNTYQIKLNEDSIDYLEANFGVHREVIDTLYRQSHFTPNLTDTMQKQFPTIPPIPKSWLTSVEKAKGKLAKL